MAGFLGNPLYGYSNAGPQGPQQTPDFSERLGMAFNSPAMALGAGLLTGANRGGSFGGGLLTGMANMRQQKTNNQGMLNFQTRNKLMNQDFQQNAMAFPQQQKMRELQLAAAQQPQPSQTTLMQNMAASGLQPGSPQYQQAMQQYLLKPVGTTVNVGGSVKAPTGFSVNKEGGLERAPGLVYPDYSAQSAGFAKRMVNAEQIFDGLTQGGFDPGSITETGRANKPFVGNYFASDEYKGYNQAKSDWTMAKLRKESGGVINDEEKESEENTYFPQAGDSQGLIQQKREARQLATQSMMQQSQGAFGEWNPDSKRAWATLLKIREDRIKEQMKLEAGSNERPAWATEENRID